MQEMITDYGLDALAAMLHEVAKEKGFWDGSILMTKLEIN